MILIALLCSAAVAQTVVRSELISYDKLRNATFGDDLLHVFSQKPEKVRVTVQCKLKRGDFSWRVENPEGKTIWQQSISGRSNVDLKDEFPGAAGEWRIVIDYKEAKGKYYIKMEAVP
jgi:hypothetical protein